jgi:hypothetical protein
MNKGYTLLGSKKFSPSYWVSTIESYTKKGVGNRDADALSRRPEELQSCHAISSCQLQWLQELVDSYESDPSTKDIITKLTVDPSAVPHFTWQQGLLRYKNRVWVGSAPLLQQKLIIAFRDSALGGHSGVPVTYRKLKQFFAWKSLKVVVQDYVQSCVTCQQAKPDRSKNPGLLQPLPIPDEAWQIITMDFIEGLPNSGNANCILVVADKFTKLAHFLPLMHPYTAASVARLFLDSVYKLHGMLVSIISDRDRVFTSLFWKELFSLARVKLRISTAYHPHSDGQTERVNQCLETFLRCFVTACPNAWSNWLSLAEFWYNTSFHFAIG